MKKLLASLFALIVTATLFAQAPNMFNYQGLARDLPGNPLTNKNIGIRISILQGSTTGVEVYKEIHQISTNSFGLFNIQIGKGTGVTGNIGTIDWGNGNFYLKIEMDENGGSNFQLMGINQLLSVPYALYAKSSGNSLNLIPPTVTASAASNIGFASATLIGTVNGNGFKTDVTFEWDTTTNYGNSIKAIQDPVVGSDNVAVSAKLTGLPSNKSIYYRIKASNAINVVVSNSVIFQTKNVPQVVTTPITSIKEFSAQSGGFISGSVGTGAVILGRGVCWNNSGNPTINDNATLDNGGPGNFTSNISGLLYNTKHYVRAYARTTEGIIYGNELSFITAPMIIGPIVFNPDLTYGSVSDIDGNVYRTIQIGTQIWMAENLKTTRYKDGISIPNVNDFTEWSGLNTGAFCWYRDDVTPYKATYGPFYNWFSVNTGKLCPDGWHVPSDTEWTTLTAYLGGNDIAGSKLKETGNTHWQSPNTGATNTSGFTALPGGSFDVAADPEYSGSSAIGSSGKWWSSSANTDNDAIYKNVWNGSNEILSGILLKQSAFSVRCLKD